MVQEITSLAQFSAFKSKPLLIIDFYADWCGPCKAISPVFERLAQKHKSNTNVIFAKVNVDVARDVSSQCGITAMPTFQFYSTGIKKDEVRGADVQSLTRKIDSFVSTIKTGPTGPGNKLGSNATFSASTPTSSREKGNLREYIDVDASRAIHSSPTCNIKQILRKSYGSTGLESVDGPQVLLFIVFSRPVSLSSITINAPHDAAPSRVHVGSNVSPSVVKDLNALQTASSVQSFSLFSDEYLKDSTTLTLKSAKFSKVDSIALLIESNLSSENQVTRINLLEFIGTVTQ